VRVQASCATLPLSVCLTLARCVCACQYACSIHNICIVAQQGSGLAGWGLTLAGSLGRAAIVLAQPQYGPASSARYAAAAADRQEGAGLTAPRRPYGLEQMRVKRSDGRSVVAGSATLHQRAKRARHAPDGATSSPPSTTAATAAAAGASTTTPTNTASVQPRKEDPWATESVAVAELKDDVGVQQDGRGSSGETAIGRVTL
jgi:hypothetical protein